MIQTVCSIQMHKNLEENKTANFILRLRKVKHKSRLVCPVTRIKNLLFTSAYFLHNYNLPVSLICFFIEILKILPGYIVRTATPSVSVCHGS